MNATRARLQVRIENGAEQVLAAQAVAAGNKGWWRVWLETDGTEKSFELFSLRALVVQADSPAAAGLAALAADGDPKAHVSQVDAYADPNDPETMAVAMIADTISWFGDHLPAEIRSLLAGEPLESAWELSEQLPGCFEPFYTAKLLAGYTQALTLVSGKLACFPDTYLASTIEELAGHALLNQAKASTECERDEGRLQEQLAAAIIERLQEMQEDAFEDWDVTMLFEPQFAGIESNAIGQLMGVANLHPDAWFTPFRAEQPAESPAGLPV